ncbi:hypothetical protein P7K49_025113 [Saguinus oedipus]|uniref:Integrase-type domain-containing protein n=1 Tax=Saguinus oedipus TaxID=9490 RepID=A0ABQ9UG58_SAGOE|nr:hypothetical protein P7K49_025113 [Saguinus oedipus]
MARQCQVPFTPQPQMLALPTPPDSTPASPSPVIPSPQTRQPGLCPRCRCGTHWPNGCHSKHDAQGNPLPQRSDNSQVEAVPAPAKYWDTLCSSSHPEFEHKSISQLCGATPNNTGLDLHPTAQQQAETSHALHHQNVHSLRLQFQIPREQAHQVVKQYTACLPYLPVARHYGTHSNLSLDVFKLQQKIHAIDLSHQELPEDDTIAHDIVDTLSS